MPLFLRRVLPAIFLALTGLLAACATNDQPVAAGFTGTWRPSAAVVQNNIDQRGGVTNAEMRGGDVVVDWAHNGQKVTLTRSPLRQVAAGREQWTGGVTLADGTPATLTLDCPVPTGRRMTCRVTVQGQFRTSSYSLVLSRV